MATESAGLWLIGIGALLLALVGFAGGRVRLALTFSGSGDQRPDRLKFAISGAGLLSTATGSLLIAISSIPSAPFLVGTIAALVFVIYVLLVWRVHTLWRERVTAAAHDLRDNQDSEREQWLLDATRWYARWRWSLRHPLTTANATSWPAYDLENVLGPRPPGPPESHEDPRIAMKLRQNRPNVARVDADVLPSWTLDIVLVARDCAWTVLRSKHVLALYTPDRLHVETVDLDCAPALVQWLRREALLAGLARLGLPTHRTLRGQRGPGRDRAHRRSILTQAAPDEHQDLPPAQEQ